MLEAGRELDRRVAEAIGWWIDETRPLDWMGSNGVSVEEFRPSTDLSAAFSAAERVFLPNGFRLYVGGWCWCEYWARQGQIESLIRGDGETPALAICGAILKLREGSDGTEADSRRAGPD